MNGIDNIKAAIQAGEDLATLKARGTVFTVTAGATPYMVVPQGFTVQEVEKHLPAPLRTRATVDLDEPESFIAYVNRFKDEHSVVFSDLEQRAFLAVLDYHRADGAPRWGSHRAALRCPTTDDWDTWMEQDRKPMDQIVFAQFIEDHIPNIAQPSGAELLQLALTLEAKKDVQFRSSTRLEDGQHQFRYEETIEGQAGSQNGLIKIPNAFVLGLEPFQGVGARRVDARFRYRIQQGGVLKLWFELVRPQEVLEAAFRDVITQIRTGLGDTCVLAGTAPSA